MTENRDQKVVGQHRIQRYPALRIALQADVLFNDDQRPDLLGGECGRCEDDLFMAFLAPAPAVPPQERGLAEPGEGAANLALVQDDNRKDDVREKVREQPLNRSQMEEPGC